MHAVFAQRRPFGLAAGLFAILASGCGAQTYEQRLEETRRYYAYLEKLDANLSPTWKEGPVDEMRVPLQFRALPKPPPPPKRAEGEPEEPFVDPRQPRLMGLELPGLLGAWESTFDVVINGQKQQQRGFLYIVSNYSMFSSEQASQAPEFTRTLLGTVTDKLSLPPVDPVKDSRRETYPRSASYTPPNNFDVYRFASPDLKVDGVPYTIEIYAHAQRDLQANLVLIKPEGIDSPAKLAERLPLMLERFKVSARKPSGGPRPAGGPPAPSGGPPTSTGF